MPHFMIVLIPYINLLNLSWIKNVYFFEYGAYKEEEMRNNDDTKSKRNCNRGTALERSVQKLLGWEGLNQFIHAKPRAYVLYSVEYKYKYGPHKGFLICETSQYTYRRRSLSRITAYLELNISSLF